MGLGFWAVEHVKRLEIRRESPRHTELSPRPDQTAGGELKARTVRRVNRNSFDLECDAQGARDCPPRAASLSLERTREPHAVHCVSDRLGCCAGWNRRS